MADQPTVLNKKAPAGVQPHADDLAPRFTDEAAFFSSAALARATRESHELDRRFKRSLVVETFRKIPTERIDTFKAIAPTDAKAKDKFFFGWAADRFKLIGAQNIYVLISQDPFYVRTIVSKDTAKNLFTSSDVRRLNDLLIKGCRQALKAKDATEKQRVLDRALLDALALVRERLELELNPPRFVKNTVTHAAFTGAVLFSQDDEEFITAGFDNTFRVWSVRTLALREVVRPPRHGGLYRAALSPDGSRLAIASGNLIYLFARPTWKIEHQLAGHKLGITQLAFSADGERLASSSNEKVIRIWNTRDGRCERTLEGHTDAVRDIAFAPDGARLLSNSKDGTARIWSLKSGETEAPLQGHPKGGDKVAWSPDGMTLATGGMGEIRFWNADGAPLRSLRRIRQRRL